MKISFRKGGTKIDKGQDFRYQLERKNEGINDKMQLVEGYDEAIMGYTDSWNGAPNGRREFKVGRPHRAVYNREKCISILKEKDDISQDEAERHFESEIVWNLMNHWQNGPVFVEVFNRRDLSVGKGKDLRTQLDEINDNILEQICVIDNFNDALLGYTVSFMGMNPDMDAPDDQECTNSRPMRVVYDRDLCIRILAKGISLKLKEAAAGFESETASEYLGVHTPVFVSVLQRRTDYKLRVKGRSDCK
jgi:hypothetical protein